MDPAPDDRGSAAAARPREEQGLLERDAELAALEAAIESASEGTGRCVIIEGAPGIGKTSLLRAAAGRATAAGLRALSARGSELEQALPYGVVRQLFERDLARASPEERDLALAGAAGLAAPLLVADRPAGPVTSTEDAGFAVVHGLYWLAANLSEQVPLLVAVDDLHWADSASLRWIAYLAHRIEGLALVVAAPPRGTRDDRGVGARLRPRTVADRSRIGPAPGGAARRRP
jgi:AAA ATPase domain